MTFDLFKSRLTHFFGEGKQAQISARHRKMIRRIRKQFSHYEKIKDAEIATIFQGLLKDKNLDENGEFNEITTCDIFALVVLASTRALGMTHYDVQIAAGLVMIERNIAEMATGEGKTLVATLPSSYFALLKKGVHVMTVNAYLAERDCELMKPVYSMLGLSVGYVCHDMEDAAKKQAYLCDVTYGVGTDFGFDYLNDQLKVQRLPKQGLGYSFQLAMKGLQLA